MDSNDVQQEWAERSGEYSPTYYAHYGSDETSERVRSIIERYVDRDASILEVGCSSGRHLAELAEAGFTELTGVDVNEEALDVLAANYPDLAETGAFHATTIEDFVADAADDAFDVVFSVETLQHIHPDAAWAFDDLARITGDLLITVENESGDHGEVNHVDDGLPLYYRDWNRVFTQRGFEEVESTTGKRDTLRAFRPVE